MVSNIFYFHPWGNDPIWRAYFSKGLKPPTRFSLGFFHPILIGVVYNSIYKDRITGDGAHLVINLWGHNVSSVSKVPIFPPGRCIGCLSLKELYVMMLDKLIVSYTYIIICDKMYTPIFIYSHISLFFIGVHWSHPMIPWQSGGISFYFPSLGCTAEVRQASRWLSEDGKRWSV